MAIEGLERRQLAINSRVGSLWRKINKEANSPCSARCEGRVEYLPQQIETKGEAAWLRVHTHARTHTHSLQPFLLTFASNSNNSPHK